MPKPVFKSNKRQIEEIIRVNHAGEYGAKRIYEGQLKAIKGRQNKEIINDMYKSELVHFKFFDNFLKERNIRPTFLLPIWNAIGYSLGVISAKIGSSYAMLLTDAVENVIESHYNSQINYLTENNLESELNEKIISFRNEEIAHREIAIENSSQKAPLARSISFFIKAFCRLSIKISKKV